MNEILNIVPEQCATVAQTWETVFSEPDRKKAFSSERASRQQYGRLLIYFEMLWTLHEIGGDLHDYEQRWMTELGVGVDPKQILEEAGWLPKR